MSGRTEGKRVNVTTPTRPQHTLSFNKGAQPRMLKGMSVSTTRANRVQLVTSASWCEGTAQLSVLTELKSPSLSVPLRKLINDLGHYPRTGKRKEAGEFEEKPQRRPQGNSRQRENCVLSMMMNGCQLCFVDVCL